MDSTILRTPKIPQHVLQEDSKSQTSINFRTYLTLHRQSHRRHATIIHFNCQRQLLQSPEELPEACEARMLRMLVCCAILMRLVCWFAGPIASKKTHISYQRSSVIHHLKGKHLATPVLGYPLS